MPVTVLCPACDCELSADKPTGSVQCPTCWAKVPLETAKRKPTDTPPPKAPAPPVPTARKAAAGEAPPRAKRVTKEPTRPLTTRAVRAAEKPKGSGAIWVVVILAVVLACGAGAMVFTLSHPPAEDALPTVAAQTTKRDEEETTSDNWVPVAVPEGATLLAPGPVQTKSVTVAGEAGVRHSASEGETTAEVYAFDVKHAHRVDREEFLSRLLGTSSDRVSVQGVRPIPGGDATEYTASDVAGFDHAGLVIGRGGRWFVFHIAWKPEDDPKERRRSQFISRAGVTWLRPEVPADPPKLPKPADPPKPKPPATPPKPKDPKGQAEPITETWIAIENKAGFEAVAPKGVRPEKQFVEQKRLPLGGVKWQTDDRHCTYHVSYLDLPDKFDPDTAKLLKAVVPFGTEVGADSDTTAGGKKATEWYLKQWDQPRAKAVTVKRGFRLFVAYVVSKHGKAYGEDATFTQRADKFMTGLKFTFDSHTDDAYPGEAKWAAVPNAVGFVAKVPAGANTAAKPHDLGFNPKITGKHYRSEGGGMVFEVFVHDLPAKRSASDVMKELLGFDKVVSGPTEIRGADRRWTTYELGSPERPVLFRTATVGSRVFTIRVFPERQGDERVGAREFRDKATQFFDQFSADD